MDRRRGGQLASSPHFGRLSVARAAARVDEILASHAPEPLPKDVRRALRAVVEEREARHGRSI